MTTVPARAPAPIPAGPVRQMQLSYDADQDRIRFALVLKTGTPARFLVTRRLAARLIDGFAALLARTSPVAAKAPAEMRDDIILIEHQGALADAEVKPVTTAGAPAARGAPTAAVAGQARLLRSVDIQVHRHSFELAFRAAGGEPVAFHVTRTELHRLVELLSRHAGEAGWNLAPETGWLAGDGDRITLN